MTAGARLLADIRRIADADARRTHFIGSILASRSLVDGDEELMLIDGQRRVITLTLLVAALRQVVRESDAGLARELTSILEHPRIPDRTRVRPHRTGVTFLEGLVFDRPVSTADLEMTLYDENYAYFLAEVADDAHRVWQGLQRLEHVTVTLREHANPQQVFESMNATGAPLRSDELIHNYVLMGLTHAQQTEIEDGYWVEIERNTGQAVEEFFRDYLVLKTWRDDQFKGEHGVYDVFKQQFPALKFDRLESREAPEWLRYSQIYGILLTPSVEQDAEPARHLRYVATFGRAMYPLLLGVYDQYDRKAITSDDLREILELLQSLFIRKMVVGESRDGIIARLCKTWGKSRRVTQLQRDIVRRTPSNARVRSALHYRYLPHAGYVLGRLQDRDIPNGLEIEHIFPVAPAASWRGCEEDVPWGERSEDEKARLRERANTIGNLTLLEQPLNGGAGNHSFHRKQQHYYSKSAIGTVQSLLDVRCWGVGQILSRAEDLTKSFLNIWPRPTLAPEEEGQLTAILDVPRRFGYYAGWDTEFAYAVFRGETLEVRNIKELFLQVFTRLLAERRNDVLACNPDLFSPIAKHPQYELIARDPDLFANKALFPGWQLKYLQDVVDELDVADGLLVRFASDEADDDVIESFAEREEATDDSGGAELTARRPTRR